jgi:hypothetical protein
VALDPLLDTLEGESSSSSSSARSAAPTLKGSNCNTGAAQTVMHTGPEAILTADHVTESADVLYDDLHVVKPAASPPDDYAHTADTAMCNHWVSVRAISNPETGQLLLVVLQLDVTQLITTEESWMKV